jgi:hypothetical protein
MKKLFLLFPLLTAACGNSIIKSADYLEIDVIGTEAAYCILSTKDNRYALDAPGKTLVERDNDALKIDCRDNFSDRRRVVNIEPNWNIEYFSYPDKVTIDFASTETGTRYNGFRVKPVKDDCSNCTMPDPVLTPIPDVSMEILTEDSFSAPVETSQTYPIEKQYNMGRRSGPIALY